MAGRYYQTSDKEEELKAETQVPRTNFWVYGNQLLRTTDSESFGTKSYQRYRGKTSALVGDVFLEKEIWI